MHHYWNYLELDRRQKQLQGLIAGLEAKGIALQRMPQDKEKAEETMIALGNILSHLRAYEQQLEQVVKGARFITGPGSHRTNDSSMFGRRGQVSGEARRSLNELRRIRQVIEGSLDHSKSLSGGRSGRIAYQTKEGVETIGDWQKLFDEIEDLQVSRSVGFQAPTNGAMPSDPVTSIATTVVLVAGLLASWLERRRKRG